MPPRAVVLAWILLLATAPAFAATEASIPFQEFTLPNGLRVFLSEDHRAPQVTVNVWYHVGAANQGPGKSGFAHLFEHMMFAGSLHVPDPDKVLAAVGGGCRRLGQRQHQLRPDRLLRDRPGESAAGRAVDRVGPDGVPAPGPGRAEARHPAGRGQQRAAAELREPALRARPAHPLRHALSEAPPVLPLRHREHRGDPGREHGGHPGVLPRVLRPPERHPGPGGRLRPEGRPRAGDPVLRGPARRPRAQAPGGPAAPARGRRGEDGP